MKLSDQFKLLLELEGKVSSLEGLEERVSALERAFYRLSGDTSTPAPQVKPTPEKVVEAPKKEKEIDLSEASIQRMSKTEMSQIAVKKGHRGATRAVYRDDLAAALLSNSAEKIEDPLESVRETINHFITKVQPSLRQTLRCSCDCMGVCPRGQVIDCWTSNKQKFEELTA